jgi:hypothetical protein
MHKGQRRRALITLVLIPGRYGERDEVYALICRLLYCVPHRPQLFTSRAGQSVDGIGWPLLQVDEDESIMRMRTLTPASRYSVDCFTMSHIAAAFHVSSRTVSQYRHLSTTHCRSRRPRMSRVRMPDLTPTALQTTQILTKDGRVRMRT